MYNIPSFMTGLRCPVPILYSSGDNQYGSDLLRGPEPSDALVFAGFCPNIVQLLIKGINFTFPSSMFILSLISASILRVELNKSTHMFSLVCHVTLHLRISGVTDGSSVSKYALILILL